MSGECILFWAHDGAVVREAAYRFAEHPAPLVRRDIGTLVGGRRVVVGYTDPVWRCVVELGPLTRTETALLRTRIGDAVSLTFHDSARQLAAYPHAEIWWQATMAAEMLDARPRPANADISQGDIWSVSLQWHESGTGAISLPP